MYSLPLSLPASEKGIFLACRVSSRVFSCCVKSESGFEEIYQKTFRLYYSGEVLGNRKGYVQGVWAFADMGECLI